MTLTELRYVVAVAEARHFGQAAERCFVSQPSLSASVKNLEEELGVKLFERGKRGVFLTEAGEQIVAQARRALEEAERVKTVARQGRDPLKGVLRLGIIHTVAPYLLPELVGALLAGRAGNAAGRGGKHHSQPGPHAQGGRARRRDPRAAL